MAAMREYASPGVCDRDYPPSGGCNMNYIQFDDENNKEEDEDEDPFAKVSDMLCCLMEEMDDMIAESGKSPN